MSIGHSSYGEEYKISQNENDQLMSKGSSLDISDCSVELNLINSEEIKLSGK